MLLSSSSPGSYSPITLSATFLQEENFNGTLIHPLTPLQVQELIFHYERDYIKNLPERKWPHPKPFCYPYSLMKVGDSLFFVLPSVSLNTEDSESNISRSLFQSFFNLCQSFKKYGTALPRDIRILLLIHFDKVHWSALNWHLEINPTIGEQVSEINNLVDWPGLYARMHFYYADSAIEGLAKRQKVVQRLVRYFVTQLSASLEMSVVQHAGGACADHAILNGFLKAIRGSYLQVVDSRLLHAWTQQILSPMPKVEKRQAVPLIFSKASEPFVFIRDFEDSFCQSPLVKEAMVCRLNHEAHALLHLGNDIFFQAFPVVNLSNAKNYLSEKLTCWFLEMLAYWLITDQLTFARELRTCIVLYHPDARQWSVLNARFEMQASCQEIYASFKEAYPREELVNAQIIKTTVDNIKLARMDLQHLYPGPHYFPLPLSKISFTHVVLQGFERLDDNVLHSLDIYNTFSQSTFSNHAVESRAFDKPRWVDALSFSLTKSVEDVSLSAVSDLSDNLKALSLTRPE